MMKIDVLTLFPEMFAPMNYSMMGQAQERGLLEFRAHDFRQYAVNKHGHVDDYPYGGGAGMLLRVEPIVAMLEELQRQHGRPNRIILTDPAGQPFSQDLAQEWSNDQYLIFICGHYEGFDERVRHYVTDQVSLGDYVLTNGELPTMVMMDAVVRLIPEVVGNADSLIHESHQQCLLEYPQYTRPQNFRGMEVPPVLLSGHHEHIERWRRKEALRKTWHYRPDLLKQGSLSDEDQRLLDQIQREDSTSKTSSTSQQKP